MGEWDSGRKGIGEDEGIVDFGLRDFEFSGSGPEQHGVQRTNGPRFGRRRSAVGQRKTTSALVLPLITFRLSTMSFAWLATSVKSKSE